jgi:uncharacterized membrane protein
MKLRSRRDAGYDLSLMAWPYVAGSLLLGFVLPRLHQGPFAWANPILRQEQVITFLSSVSSGMMAFTGIVFSMLFIMLQFGSSAYSPHLVPVLSRNLTLTHAGGVFTGTFLYSLMALREVGTLPDGRTPALTVWIAFLWLVASVFLMLRLVRVFAGLAITEVLEMLGDRGRSVIRESYGPWKPAEEADVPSASPERGRSLEEPAEEPREPVLQTLVHEGKPLYLVGMDLRRLVALAEAAGSVIRVLPAVGDPVAPCTRLAVVEGAHRIPQAHLLAALWLANDRTGELSPKQSLRLLVDIALHALSHGINDPTSAVRALDQIESLLVELGRSYLGDGRARDAAGSTRVVYPPLTWEECLELGSIEIQDYGSHALQVDRRLAAMYEHLLRVLPEPRRSAVRRLDERRIASVERVFHGDDSLRWMAERADRQGLGHTASGG